ncbi:MAG: hypothetical protein AB7S80_06360 [Rhizobiaceae bacterium]
MLATMRIEFDADLKGSRSLALENAVDTYGFWRGNPLVAARHGIKSIEIVDENGLTLLSKPFGNQLP